MRLPEYWKDWKDCNPAEKTKLLPCPFCGGKAVYIFDDGADWNKGIACKKCELNIYFFKKGWNVSSGRIGSGLEDKIAIAECWNRLAKVRTLTVGRNSATNDRKALLC